MPSTTGQVVRVDYIGESKQPIIIIDNCMNDALDWVNYAATQVTFHTRSQFYPGVRAAAPREYGNHLYSLIIELVRQVFGWENEADILSCDFSLVTKAHDELLPIQRVPHIDFTDPDGLAVLHFLCEPKHGGTSFYRHRSTRYELILANIVDDFVNIANEETRQLGMPPPRFFNESTPQFERIAQYEARFNRLLIYRGALLHSGNPQMPSKPELDPRSGRLTVNTFLKRRF